MKLIVPLILQLVGVGIIIAEFIVPTAGVLATISIGIFGYSLYYVFAKVSISAGVTFVLVDLLMIPILVVVGVKMLASSRATLQEGVILATASAVLSTPRAAARPVMRPATAHPPFDAVTPMPADRPGSPRFTHHFEYRVTGPAPLSGGSEPLCSGWLRMREPLGRIDAPAVIAHLDAYWSAILTVEPALRPFATIAFVAELLADPGSLCATEPFFHDARVLAASEGFVVEERALYQGERLVALNHQTFAMIA
jgi:hypothetical protein